MNLGRWWQLLTLAEAGRWPVRIHVIIMMLAVLFCAALTTIVSVVTDRHLKSDAARMERHLAENLASTEALWQLQASALAAEQQHIYLDVLARQFATRQPTSGVSDVTHYMDVLRRSALLGEWQQLAISYAGVEEAVELELRATLVPSSLSAFWSALQESGNLFDILHLALQVSERPGAFTVHLTLQPRLTGTLPDMTAPEKAECTADRCELTVPAPVLKHKGFLLRAYNNQEELTHLASDHKGRVSAAVRTVNKEVQDD